MIEEFIGRTFAARNNAHVAHLTTKSYAHHKALGHFYEDLVPAVDAVAECYQGHFGPIGEIEIAHGEHDNIAAYLREEADWIESNREEIAGDSAHVANLVDAVTAIYTRCVYRLENLS